MANFDWMLVELSASDCQTGLFSDEGFLLSAGVARLGFASAGFFA
jgi:hypothetical protein